MITSTTLSVPNRACRMTTSCNWTVPCSPSFRSDQRIGKNHYLAILTADHGFSAVPEWTKSQGGDAGRLNPGLDRVT